MKAPEKLYLRKRNKLPLEVVIDKWYDKDPQSSYGSIEYTRTEAFIEKACNYWYKHNQEMVKRYGSNAILGCSEFTVNVKDFKNYMESKV